MTYARDDEDRYEIGEQIGAGGMGVVYRAKETATGRVVAMKLLHAQYCADPAYVVRFRDEARAAALLHHANIVEVLDYGPREGRYFIAMELVEGETLRSLLDRRGRLSADEATTIMVQVAAGVAAAHDAGVIHRDLKPENILIGRNGEIKVCDFGLAKAGSLGEVTTTGAALATAQYISPEEVQGKAAGPAADVYRLGLVLYEMLVGSPPFASYNAIAAAMRQLNEKPTRPRDLVSSIPDRLESVVLKSLAKRPEQRYGNGKELFDALRPLCSESVAPILAAAPAVMAPSSFRDALRASRPPAWAFASAAGLAGLLLGLGLLLHPVHLGTPASAANAKAALEENAYDQPAAASVDIAPAPADQGAEDAETIVDAPPDAIPNPPAVTRPAQQPAPVVANNAAQAFYEQVLAKQRAAAQLNYQQSYGGGAAVLPANGSVVNIVSAPVVPQTGPQVSPQQGGQGAGHGRGQGKNGN